MQIRVVARDNTFVQTRFTIARVVLGWYNGSFRYGAYGNYPKGVATIAWISGKTEGVDPSVLRCVGNTLRVLFYRRRELGKLRASSA